jgi:hypothetical protein
MEQQLKRGVGNLGTASDCCGTSEPRGGAQDTGIGEIDGAGPVLFSAQRFDGKRGSAQNNLTPTLGTGLPRFCQGP